jgi:hypothetical protein
MADTTDTRLKHCPCPAPRETFVSLSAPLEIRNSFISILRLDLAEVSWSRTSMIDATYSQAHRAAWNLRLTEGIAAGRSVATRRG